MRSRRHPGVPRYQRIVNLLLDSLTDVADDQPRSLPKEQELAHIHGVARGTIRNALAVLEQQGLIRRTAGRGGGTITIPEGVRAWRRMQGRCRIIVLTRREAPWERAICQGIAEATQQAGYECVMNEAPNRFPAFSSRMRPEDPQSVLGVITCGTFDERFITMHAEAGYPVVCVDHWPRHPLADAVVTDCFTEGQQAVELLAGYGHRELFYVGSMVRRKSDEAPQAETDAEQMEAGYRHAARVAGLKMSADRVLFALHNQCDDLARWFLAQDPRPTGGVIYSSGTLFKLRDALLAHGIRCPEDISLVCKAHKARPMEAAYVCTDGTRLGRTAVSTLLARAAGKQEAGLRIAVASEVHRGPTAGELLR